MITIIVSKDGNEVTRHYTENADFTGVIESMVKTLQDSDKPM